MDNLEKQLTQLNFSAEPKNPNYRANLRKRLLNEHVAILNEKLSAKSNPVLDDSSASTGFINFGFLANNQLFAFSILSILMVAFGLVAVAPYGSVKNIVTPNAKALETVSISGEADGAKVFIDGEFKGVAPLELDLEQGNYAVRLEKEGLGSISKVVEVKPETENKSTIVALVARNTQEVEVEFEEIEVNDTNTNENEQIVASNKLSYKNEIVGFALNYHENLTLEERINKTSKALEYIKFSAPDGGSLTLNLVANPTAESNLNNTQTETINSRTELLDVLGEQLERNLTFNEEGEFLPEQSVFALDINGQTVQVEYNFGQEFDWSQSISSLELLDSIVEAINVITPTPADIGDSEEDQADASEDVLGVDTDSGSVVDVTKNPENVEESSDQQEDTGENTATETGVVAATPGVTVPVAITPTPSPLSVYTNPVYGYSINYDDEIWNLNVSRANYPANSSQGFVFSENGQDYAVSRLRIWNEAGQEIMVVATNKSQPLYPSSYEICNSANDFVRNANGRDIRTNNSSKYDYQLCNGASSEFVLSANGNNLRFAVFAKNGTNEDIDLQELSDIVSSFSYSSQNITNTALNGLQTFSEPLTGVSFKYSPTWTVLSKRESCASSECKVVNVYDQNKQLVLKLAVGDKIKDFTADESIELSAASQVVYSFRFEFYNEIDCSEVDALTKDAICKPGDFAAGVANRNINGTDVQVVYYQDLNTSRALRGLVESFR